MWRNISLPRGCGIRIFKWGMPDARPETQHVVVSSVYSAVMASKKKSKFSLFISYKFLIRIIINNTNKFIAGINKLQIYLGKQIQTC